VKKVLTIFILTISGLMLFITTDVITLFKGTHTIVSLTSSQNDVNCIQCHQQIQNELNNSSIHRWMKCEDCHRFEVITFAKHNASGIYSGKEAHAAYTPRCLDCHTKTSITLANGTAIAIKKADAFGDANYGSDYSAHKPFVLDSLNYNLSVGENEACLACHTNYSIKIDYSYFWNINYALISWSFTSFAYNGTREYNITFSKTGAKHEFINASDINCISCHKNIYDALVNGTPSTPDDYLTHAPIEIAHSGGMSSWNAYNPWGNYRYHYIPSANRAAWVNSSYCYKCHNVSKYAIENPSASITYNLDLVIADTNSTSVHAAEALWCQTCHGSGKTKAVINNPDKGGWGHGASFVDSVANSYARTFHGDICMGCHEAAVHPNMGMCGRCHSTGDVNVYIESEPSGYATNT
jgi:hypothetical protein